MDEYDRILSDLTEARQNIRQVQLDVEEIAAQRDALQARIDAYEGHMEAWEEIDRLIKGSSLGTPEAQAAIDRTPRAVGMAITKAVEYLARVEEAEFAIERMRPVVEAADRFVSAYEGLEVRSQSLDEARVRLYAELDAVTELIGAVETWRTDP